MVPALRPKRYLNASDRFVGHNPQGSGSKFKRKGKLVYPKISFHQVVSEQGKGKVKVNFSCEKEEGVQVEEKVVQLIELESYGLIVTQRTTTEGEKICSSLRARSAQEKLRTTSNCGG